MVEFFQNLDLQFVFEVVLQVCGLFALVATATANESDNKIADALLKVVNALGANWGRAANR